MKCCVFRGRKITLITADYYAVGAFNADWVGAGVGGTVSAV